MIAGEEARSRAGIAAAFAMLLVALAVPALLVATPTAAMLLVSFALGLGLAVLTAIDVREYRLPDVLTLPLLALGLLVAWWLDLAPLWWRVLSAVIGYALLAGTAFAYERLRGRPGLGLGDAKLLAAGGAWVGGEGLPTLLLAAAASALGLVAVGRLAGWAATAATRIPFGPFLAVGTWVVWLYGPL